jgi:hypothetical protein
MVRKSIGTLLLCFMTFGLAVAAADPVPAPKKAGYGLIDVYIKAFKNMALMGSVTNEGLNAELDKMMVEAKKAKTGGDIDAIFFARYSRLIGMTKLILFKDPEQVIAPFLNGEIGRFVRDTLGEELKTEGPAAIGQMANAMAFAIIDLQIYLDTLDSRQQRYDKFVGNFSPRK